MNQPPICYHFDLSHNKANRHVSDTRKALPPLLVALMFLTLPLAMILHNIVQIAFSDGQGLLITVKDGAWAWQSGWQDSVAWFVCGMFAFLNLPIAGGLTAGV